MDRNKQEMWDFLTGRANGAMPKSNDERITQLEASIQAHRNNFKKVNDRLKECIERIQKLEGK